MYGRVPLTSVDLHYNPEHTLPTCTQLCFSLTFIQQTTDPRLFPLQNFISTVLLSLSEKEKVITLQKPAQENDTLLAGTESIPIILLEALREERVFFFFLFKS